MFFLANMVRNKMTRHVLTTNVDGRCWRNVLKNETRAVCATGGSIPAQTHSDLALAPGANSTDGVRNWKGNVAMFAFVGCQVGEEATFGPEETRSIWAPILRFFGERRNPFWTEMKKKHVFQFVPKTSKTPGP